MNVQKVYDIVERYIVTGHSIRRIAEHFHVSKSYVGACLTYLGEKVLDYDTYLLGRKRVESNLLEFKKYGKLLPSNDYLPDIRLNDPDTIINCSGNIMKEFYCTIKDDEELYSDELEGEVIDNIDYDSLDINEEIF